MSSTAFAKSPRFFDLVAAATGRDVVAQCTALERLASDSVPSAGTLFDAACGAGAHLERFAGRFAVAGIDVDPIAVQVARSRPSAPDASVGTIDAYESPEGRRFDIVIALHGALARSRSAERLAADVRRLANLRAPGGVVFVEPYLAPGAYVVGAIEAVHVDEPRIKISRAIVTKRVSHLAILDYHYLIATNLGIERHFERIERGLYERAIYERAFAAAGLAVEALDDPAFPGGLLRGT